MKPTKNLQEAIDQGFVVVRDGYDLENSYYRWCTKNNRPFIKVRLKTVYTVVSIDMISVYGYGMRKSTAEKIDKILSEPNNRKSREMYTVPCEGMSYMYARRIPIDKAYEVAKKCFECVSQENALITTDELYALHR